MDDRVKDISETSVAGQPSGDGMVEESNAAASCPSVIAKRDCGRWFVVRTTYGREERANEYLIGNNVKTFCPFVTLRKEIRGKRKTVRECRIPNLFFVYGTQRELTPLVQQNPEAPFLRFYCRYNRYGGRPCRQIITVPQQQMDTLMRICSVEDNDTMLIAEAIHKFEKGNLVRVIEGPFRGVVGRVQRFRGQQRVGIVISNVLTALTAYIPNAYLELIEEDTPDEQCEAEEPCSQEHRCQKSKAQQASDRHRAKGPKGQRMSVERRSAVPYGQRGYNGRMRTQAENGRRWSEGRGYKPPYGKRGPENRGSEGRWYKSPNGQRESYGYRPNKSNAWRGPERRD